MTFKNTNCIIVSLSYYHCNIDYLSTELPMLVSTLVARSIRSLPMFTLNALVMWLQNSTLIPT